MSGMAMGLLVGLRAVVRERELAVRAKGLPLLKLRSLELAATRCCRARWAARGVVRRARRGVAMGR